MQRTHRWRMLIGLSLLAVVLVVLGACGSEDEPEPTPEPTEPPVETNASETRGMVLGEPRPAEDFDLVDHEGNPFRLSDHEGRVIAMFFGYTHCPDICPLTLMHMSTAIDELGEQADDALFLFLTVDPERDTPEQMEKYVARTEKDVIGLTGDREELERVWEAYDIIVEIEPREGDDYLIGHSAQIWLVNPAGQLAMVLPPTADGDDLAHDVRWLLERSS